MGRYWNAGITAVTAAAAFVLYAAGAGRAAGAAGFGLTALLVLAALCTAASLRGCTLTRYVQSAGAVTGSAVRVTIAVKHRSVVPLPWLVIRDSGVHERTGNRFAVRKVVFPWFRREVEASYVIRYVERGRYALDGLEATAGDGFGLLQRTVRSRETDEFLVRPAAEPLFWQVDASGSGSDSPLHWRTEPAEPGIRLREYAQGDPMRHISWKASAKAGRMISRGCDEEVPDGLLLLVDGSQSYSVRTEEESERSSDPLLEKRIRIAAGLLKGAQDERVPVGIGAVGSRFAYFTPESKALPRELWDALAVMEPSAGGRLFADAVLTAGLASPSAAVVCVTSQVDEPLAASIRLLRSRRRTPTVLYVPSEEAASSDDAYIWLEHLDSLGCPCIVWGRQQGERKRKGGRRRGQPIQI